MAHFESVKNRIESLVPNLRKIKLHDHPMGKTEAERTYRAWCLENWLFLNPLNDLGSHSVANRDIVMLPSFTTKVTLFRPRADGIPGALLHQARPRFASLQP